MAAPIAEHVAFIGLGAMGYELAGRVAKECTRCVVWDCRPERATQHAAEHGSVAAVDLKEVCPGSTVVITCLPTSVEVGSTADALGSLLSEGTIWADCTSGEPGTSRDISGRLAAFGVRYVDAPVSGGPTGARAGTLACMLGGADDAVEKVLPIIRTFAKSPVHIGPVGSGHATKCVNNALNASHLLMASEALAALVKFGIDPEKALSAINNSSGRSLQTEKRIPDEVLTRQFHYGFQLGLMRKDVRIACGLLDECVPDAPGGYFATTLKSFDAAVEDQGFQADYTESVKWVEKQVGVTLEKKSA